MKVLKSGRMDKFHTLFLILFLFFTMMGLGFSSTGQVFLDVNPMGPKYSLNGSNETSIYSHEPILLYTKWDDNVNLSHAILSTNETSAWKNYTNSYDSPKTLTGTSTWSNFTWQNSSLFSEGTKIINWKIYANDTEGYENVTSEMNFTANSYYLYDIVIVCQQDTVNRGQSVSADITVTNNGDFEGDTNIDWWIEDAYGTNHTSGSTVVNISSGESWTSTKSLLVPSTASAGVYYYKIRVTAETYSNTAHDTFEVLIPTATTVSAPSPGAGIGGVAAPTVVEKKANVEVTYKKDLIIVAGIPKKHEIKIKNSGDITLNNLSLYLQGIELSWYQIEPTKVDLEINESKTFIINFIVPASAQIKKYPVNILIKSEELEKTVYLTLNVIELLGKTEFEKLREKLEEEIRNLEEQVRGLEERGIPVEPLQRLLFKAREKINLAINEMEAGDLAEASVLINEAKFIIDVIRETITTVIPLGIIFGIWPLWIIVLVIIILATMLLIVRKVTSGKKEDKWSKLYKKWKKIRKERQKEEEF